MNGNTARKASLNTSPQCTTWPWKSSSSQLKFGLWPLSFFLCYCFNLSFFIISFSATSKRSVELPALPLFKKKSWNVTCDLWEDAHGKYIYLFLIPVSCIWDWCHLRLDWLIELLLVIKHSDGKIHQSCFWRNKVWGTFLAASLRQRMPCDPLLYNSSSSSLPQVIRYMTICLTNNNISTYSRLAPPVVPNINSSVLHVEQFKKQTMRLLENDMTPVARFHLI